MINSLSVVIKSNLVCNMNSFAEFFVFIPIVAVKSSIITHFVQITTKNISLFLEICKAIIKVIPYLYIVFTVCFILNTDIKF